MFILGGEPEHNQVREYRTGSGEWEEESKWPQLGGKGRIGNACSVLGSQLIVTGGLDSLSTVLSTSASLDLASGPGAAWLEGGRMNSPRVGHAMVTVGAAGRERIYVLGGWYGGKSMVTRPWTLWRGGRRGAGGERKRRRGCRRGGQAWEMWLSWRRWSVARDPHVHCFN